MLSELELGRIATLKAIDIYGKKYLQDNYYNTCRGHGIIDQGKTFYFFLGLKTSDDLPNHEADDHGWVVSATMKLDTETGEFKFLEYTTE